MLAEAKRDGDVCSQKDWYGYEALFQATDQVELSLGYLALLQEFEQLEDDLVIYASGSPRGNRLLSDRLPRMRAVKTTAGILRRIDLESLPEEYQTVASAVLSFREPKTQWQIDPSGEASDNSLSLSKTRVFAAAVILLQILNRKNMPSRFTVIGRDYNVATRDREFMGKAGYSLFGFPEDQRSLPAESWAIKGMGPEPIEPLDQLISLLRPEGRAQLKNPPPFYIANSASVIELDLKGIVPFPEELSQLVNTTSSLPLWVKERSRFSFMAVRPDSEAAEAAFYSVGQLEIEAKGSWIYRTPGVIDWTRGPWRDHLKVFVPHDGQIIRPSFRDLFNLVSGEEKGMWVSYAELCAKDLRFEDELAGFPTDSLRELLGY